MSLPERVRKCRFENVSETGHSEKLPEICHSLEQVQNMPCPDQMDELLNKIGFGRWQILGIIANFLIWLVLSPHTIGTTLFNAPVPFQCWSRPSTEDGPVLRSPNVSLASHIQLKSIEYDSNCLEEAIVASVNERPSTESKILAKKILTVSETPLLETFLPSCPYIHYDDSVFTSTVTSEWHLVCEHSYMRSLFQTTYIAGLIIGCFLGGYIGDRIGRAKVVLFGSTIHAISLVLVAFTTSFPLFLVGRFFIGLTNLMILIPIVTLSLETCPEHYRAPIGMVIGAPYSLGVIGFAGLGIILRDWRHLYIATSFPALLLAPIAWLLDESPRWLLQRGRYREAARVLKKAAKINGHEPEATDMIRSVVTQISERKSRLLKTNFAAKKSICSRVITKVRGAVECLKYPAMRKISLISPIIWFLNEVVYYGTIFNANTFSRQNPFLYVALTGVADALAIVTGTVTTHFSRKLTVGGSQMTSGSLLLMTLAVPESLKWLQWVFVMAGFLMCACASQALYVFTPELFPTTIRARGFATCNLTGYLGTLVAPFIPDFLAQYGWWITGTILGSFGLISGVLVMTLVETNHLPLCQTIFDVEARECSREARPSTQDRKNPPQAPLLVKDVPTNSSTSFTSGAVHNLPANS